MPKEPKKKLTPEEHRKKYPDDYIGDLRLRPFRCTNPNCKHFLGLVYLEKGAIKIKCPFCKWWAIEVKGVDNSI